MEPVLQDTAQARCTQDESERFAAFVEDLRRLGRAPKTVESYRSDWTGFVEWYAAQKGQPFDLGDLEGGSVEAWRKHLQDTGMRPSTTNRKLVFLKRYASWAHELGQLDAARCASVRSVGAVALWPVDQAVRLVWRAVETLRLGGRNAEADCAAAVAAIRRCMKAAPPGGWPVSQELERLLELLLQVDGADWEAAREAVQTVEKVRPRLAAYLRNL